MAKLTKKPVSKAKSKNKTKSKANQDNRPPRQDRTPSQIARDDLLVSSMYLKGMAQVTIAEKVGLNQATVSRTIKKLQVEWQVSQINNIDAYKRMQLEKVDQVEREAWESWEKSKGDRIERTTRSVGKTDVNTPTKMNLVGNTDIQVRQWASSGDPKYLTVIMTCIERRCKILGIDAPMRFSTYELSPNTPKPILRRVAAGMAVDVAFAEYVNGVNKDIYGE